jgi:prolyl oligopeptidase PreP (S9A serine peptidase family)
MVSIFAPSRLVWMEMGGIFAQAVLRGGGEYGEQWHLAGTGLRKQNVFDDFIASAEWLIANKYTSPAKLAIQGGSNGGLLVAAVELQRPDLFAAVLADVGVMDMLRFDKFTIGWAWKQDYGGPSDDPAAFAAIYRYSPLHNIKPGVRYPATLVTTGDHDDRVFPAHSFKFTAAMQSAASASVATPAASASSTPPALATPLAAKPSTSTPAIAETPSASPDPAGLPSEHPSSAGESAPHPASASLPANPILIRIETRAGHGAATPLTKRVESTADQFAFLVRQLKMSPSLP